jgi:hypothetical protein
MAGSWGVETRIDDGAYGGSVQSVFAVKSSFLADAADGSVPAWAITQPSAFLVGVGVVFGGVTPPDTLTVTIKDADGLEIYSEVFIASGRGDISAPIPVVANCTVELSGNSTNSATGTVILYFVNNRG